MNIYTCDILPNEINFIVQIMAKWCSMMLFSVSIFFVYPFLHVDIKGFRGGGGGGGGRMDGKPTIRGIL